MCPCNPFDSGQKRSLHSDCVNILLSGYPEYNQRWYRQCLGLVQVGAISAPLGSAKDLSNLRAGTCIATEAMRSSVLQKVVEVLDSSVPTKVYNEY